MEILKMTEMPDGSAVIEMDMTDEEKQMLINFAVIELLKKGIEQDKKNKLTE